LEDVVKQIDLFAQIVHAVDEKIGDAAQGGMFRR
jgi:hypothetical protein